MDTSGGSPPRRTAEGAGRAWPMVGAGGSVGSAGAQGTEVTPGGLCPSVATEHEAATVLTFLILCCWSCALSLMMD